MRPGERVVARCRELALVTDVEGQTTRTFLSPAMHRANALVASWAPSVTPRIDAAGNLRLRRAGTDPAAGVLVIGSHLDTVPNAGAFDGPMGVVVGLEVLERSGPTPFAIEVIGFSEEEGVRYGVPFIGSRAVVGTLSDELLARRDAQGKTIGDALTLLAASSPVATLSGSAPDLSTALDACKVSNVRAYLEVHIEQGPVLEARDLPLGVVDAIVGQSRLLLHFTGATNHAGTTPMDLRHDALAAAAEWVSAVEATARGDSALVATVGRLEVTPNAGNVIPGAVLASLDVRHPSDARRSSVVAELLARAEGAAVSRGVTLRVEPKLDQAAAPMDPRLVAILDAAARRSGAAPLTMPSGAGHDAMVLAPHMPCAMLFVRSPGGLSHHPNESVITEDVELAVQSTLAFVDALAGEQH